MNAKLTKYLIPAAMVAAFAAPLAVQAAPPPHPMGPNQRFENQHHPMGPNQRLENQHHRIQEGVKHDRLTRDEQLRLDAHEARVRAQIDRDRASGHHFTPREHRQVRHELNRDSRDIARQDRDSQHRHDRDSHKWTDRDSHHWGDRDSHHWSDRTDQHR